MRRSSVQAMLASWPASLVLLAALDDNLSSQQQLRCSLRAIRLLHALATTTTTSTATRAASQISGSGIRTNVSR